MRTSSIPREVWACQPTMRWECTWTMKTTYTQPDVVCIYVKSAAQARLGTGAVAFRFSRSGIRSPGPGIVVRGFVRCLEIDVHPSQSHRSVDGAVRHRMTVSAQAGDSLTVAVQGFRGILQAVEDVENLRVRHCPGRRRGILPVPVGPHRDLHALLAQATTDRLDFRSLRLSSN